MIDDAGSLHVSEGSTVCSFVAADPLPELSVSGCTVLYAGNPIHEADSAEAAIVYRDRLINLYM